jgi:hypothetical protein
MSVYLPPPSLNSSHSSLMGCSTGSNFFSYKIASSLLQLEPFFHGDFRLGGEGCCGQLSGGDVISKNPEPSCCAACATYIYPTPPPVLPSSSIRSLFLLSFPLLPYRRRSQILDSLILTHQIIISSQFSPYSTGGEAKSSTIATSRGHMSGL